MPGIIFFVRYIEVFEIGTIFCDHKILDGYSGFLGKFGVEFSDKTMVDMIHALENHKDFGTENENNNRDTNWSYKLWDIFSKEDGKGPSPVKSSRDVYIGTLVMDFILTFGREAMIGDNAVASMSVGSDPEVGIMYDEHHFITE